MNELHSAWECPRCHRINAPHVDQCTCDSDGAGVVVLNPPVLPTLPKLPELPEKFRIGNPPYEVTSGTTWTSGVVVGVPYWTDIFPETTATAETRRRVTLKEGVMIARSIFYDMMEREEKARGSD